MKQLKLCVVFVFLTSASWTHAISSVPSPQLIIQTVTGDEGPGSYANSEIILGRQDAILIDCQRTVENAKKVVEAIRKSGRTLTTVFITHVHPDHMLGAQEIQKAFPEAKFFATRAVAEETRSKGAAIRQFVLKTIAQAGQGQSIPSEVIVPTPLGKPVLTIEGWSLEVIEVNQAESESAAMIRIPQLDVLISGDLTYNGTHLFLAEQRFEGWIRALEKVKRMGPFTKIYPGHGEPGSAGLLDSNIGYIKFYESTVSAARSPADAISTMKKQYPGYKMERFMTYGVETFFGSKNKIHGDSKKDIQ